jgi:hypothetical protein
MSSDSLDLYLHSSCTTDEKKKYLEKCVPLYIGTLKRDWESVEKIINANLDVVYASITEGGDTVLHVAVLENDVEFVKKLIPKVKILGKMNKAGNTAFCVAAGLGNLKIIELMLDAKSTDRHLLPTLCGPDGVKPIYKAALSGHRDIVNRLYPSDFVNWPIKERAAILTACIANGLFDIGLKMIIEDKKLLVTEDAKKDTTLDVLVRMSFEFAHDDEKSNILCS